MQLSVLFEGQVAYPNKANEQRVLRAGVEQAILADRLGFDRFYVVEHHSLEGYAHSSAPEVLLSYIAAKTEHIRIAHGIVCLPFKMNHPVRVAERTAMLDILSGGRLDVGVGRSSSAREQQVFGITDEETYPQLEAGLRAIVRMWTEDELDFSPENDLLEMPVRTIRPQPMQEPHPPLAMACTKDDTFLLAGRLGSQRCPTRQTGRIRCAASVRSTTKLGRCVNRLTWPGNSLPIDSAPACSPRCSRIESRPGATDCAAFATSSNRLAAGRPPDHCPIRTRGPTTSWSQR
jgi:hypothetical protein